MSRVTFVVGPPGSGKTFYGLQQVSASNVISLKHYENDLVNNSFPLLETALGWNQEHEDMSSVVFLDDLDLISSKIPLYQAAKLRRWRQTHFIVACRTGYFTSNQEIVNHIAPVLHLDNPRDHREELLTIHQTDFVDPKYEQDVEYWLRREIARLDDPSLSNHISEAIVLLEKLALGDLEDSPFTRELLVSVKEGKYDPEYTGKSEKTNFCVVSADTDDDAPPGDFFIDTWAISLFRDASLPVQILLNAVLITTSNHTKSFWSSKMRDKLAMCCILRNPVKNLDRIWLRSQYHLLDLIDEKQDSKIIESLCNVVLNGSIAGANAATILVRLTGTIPIKDSRQIRIAGADLSGADLSKFEGVDLRGCDLSGSHFRPFNVELSDARFDEHSRRTISAFRKVFLISPAEKLFFVSFPNEDVYVYDIFTGEKLFFMRHDDDITSVALSANHKYLYCGDKNENIHGWDLSERQRVMCVKSSLIFAADVLATSTDGKWLYAGVGNIIQKWDLSKHGQIGPELYTEGHYDMTVLLVSPDGNWLYSGSDENTICRWDLSTGQTRVMQGHTSTVSSLVLSSDGERLYSGSWDKTICVWNIPTGQCIRTLKGHTCHITSLALSADGRWLYSGSEDNTVRVWDLSTDQCIRTIEHSEMVTCIALSEDDKFLYTGCYHASIHIWNVERKHKLNGSYKPLC